MIVAMGRGGPAEPQVAEAGSVDLARLLALVRSGEHAASDYLEDALTTGVTTIGARRAGGGLAGAPYATNVREAAELGVALGAGILILEGSGSAVPPVPWDAAVLVVPAAVPGRISVRISRSLPALAVRPGGCYYGCRPTCWARTSFRASLPHPPLPR